MLDKDESFGRTRLACRSLGPDDLLLLKVNDFPKQGLSHPNTGAEGLRRVLKAVFFLGELVQFLSNQELM